MWNQAEKVQRQVDRGFTLVELLIAMAVGGIVMAAVMTSFLSQHSVYLAQDEVVAMQQNARVSMDMLARDIRMAGYNPSRQAGNFTFVNNVNFSNNSGTSMAVSTNPTQIAFTSDLDGDGTVDLTAQDVDGNGIDMSDMEQIAFRLNGTTLQRYSTVTGFITWQALAENINRIEFYYLMAAGPPTLAPTATQLTDIRSVQISIMVQAAQPDTKSPPPSRTYTTPSGALWTSTPGFRSRYFTTTVQCRNLGL